MRICHVLAVAVFAFLSVGGSFARAAETGTINTSNLLSSKNNRLLRGSKTDITEERGGNLIQAFKDAVNMGLWVNLGKSDDFVKQALGLQNLSGKALKANEKYKFFKDFQAKIDEPKITAWLNKDTPTHEIWSAYGLGKLTQEELKNSREFQTYVRYANRLDDDIFKHKRFPFDLALTSPEELAVKVKLWAKAGRSELYVYEMLGESAVRGSKNYEQNFSLFKDLAREQAHKNK